MPPRRSTRAVSTTAVAKAEPAPAAKSPRVLPSKRVVSIDASTGPLPKRARTKEGDEPAKATPRVNGRTALKNRNTSGVNARVAAKGANSRVASKAKPTAPKKHAAAPEVPAINALPKPIEHERPCPQLFGWGTGNFGQLGMGPDLTGEYSKPKKNAWVEETIEDGTFGGEGAGFETVAAGGMHTLFVDEKGTVWSCGVNDEAALGRVTVNVPNPEKEGEFLDADYLTSVPHPLQSLLDEDFRAVNVAAGDSISAAISSEGDLRVWGSFRGNQGSLGFSSDSKRQFLPMAVLDLKSQSIRGHEADRFVSVAAGNNHLIALTTNGNIYTLGAGEEGQLGRRVLERRKIHGTAPEKIVLGTRARKAIVVGAGNNHTFAVDERGDTWGWGLNSKGQTGTGVVDLKVDSEVPSPKKVVGLSKGELGGAHVIQIVGGDHHTLFLTSDGRVFACGRSGEGQLGLADDNPAFADREFPDFIPVPALVTFPDMNDPIIHVSAGTHNNAAVTRGGALYAWGAQTQGELGLGHDDDDVKTPEVVVRKEGGSWSAVTASCGGQHTVALLRTKKKPPVSSAGAADASKADE